MSLGLRLALLVFLAAAPIFAYEINTELSRRDERRLAATNEVRQLAALIAANESRFVDSAHYLLSAVAKLDSVVAEDGALCNRELESIKSQFPDLNGIGALRPDGMSFCAATTGIPAALAPVSLADRPYIQQALRTKSLSASGYILGRRSGAGTLNFALPALNDSNELTAIVLLAFSTASLSQALREIPLPVGATVTLLDSSGTVVARSPEEDLWVGKSVADRPFVKQVLAQAREGTVEGIGLDDVDRLYGFARVKPPANLSIAVGIRRDAVFVEVDRRFREEMLFLGIVVLLVAALTYGYGEYGFRRPIKALERAVDRYMRGEAMVVEPPASGINELIGLSRHLGEMSAELHDREAALKSAVVQKEILLKEVNHRVKNSLQLVASLFSLHVMEIKDPEARRQFIEATKRVSTVARVHQRLYEGSGVDRVDFGAYLRELCDDLHTSLGEGSTHQLICEADDSDISTDQVIPLALIVNELITNAFKYAMPSRPAKVEVRFHHTTNGSLRLTVSDNGPGLRNGIDSVKGGGLGLRMVDALTQQLRGELDVATSDRGTMFTIALIAR